MPACHKLFFKYIYSLVIETFKHLRHRLFTMYYLHLYNSMLMWMELSNFTMIK